MTLLNAKLNENTQVDIEVEDSHFVSSGLEKTGLLDDKIASLAEDALTRSIGVIIAMGEKFAQAKQQASFERPLEFEISFGVKVSAEGDVWIAKVGSECQISAKITWK